MSLLDTVFEPTFETQIVSVKQIFKDDTTFDGTTNSFSQYPKIDITPYVNPSNDYEFTTKKYTDDLTATKAPINNPTFTGTISGISKSMVGLANVDNTTDLLKPISTDTQAALDLKATLASNNDFTSTNTFNSYLPTSTLTPSGSTQLTTKSYVDSVVASVINSAPSTLDTLNELATALGNDPNFATSVSTSIGLKAPIANPTFTGTVSGITKSMVGLANVDNTTDAAKPISTLTQSALDLKAPLANPTFTGTLNCSALTPSSIITSSIFTENITSVTPAGGTTYTLNFALGNVFYSSSNPTANFTANITNIPTSSTGKQFTISLIVNAGAYYCTSASAVDTTPTTILAAAAPKYSGGVVPTAGTFAIVIHTFTLIQCYGTKYIIYSTSTFN